MKLSKKSAALAVGLAALIALTGCAQDKLAEQYREGSGKNYIAGDGSITEVALANRGEAISFTATDLDGNTVSSKDFAGKVVVVNFWYAGCAPCRAEAKDLEKVYQHFAGKNVVFLGVNVRDGADTARTFNSTFGVTYPSVTDLDGKVQLAFSSSVPPNAVPTTLVLDTKGRVAARVLGRLASDSILITLVGDQLKAAS
ncbi:MAG: Thiol-disulfide oxidoreductase ResA [Actinomycetota bacterium]|jgi:peroxiredoxin